MKKSKPIALDRRDIHSLLDVIGGFGAVVAVGIIAMLSVCAAFFIYRSFRGQRGKGDENNGNETTVATGEESTARRRRRERDDRPTESTGECQSEKQKKCSESTDLSSTDNMLLPAEVPEKDLNESTLKDLEEITDELLTDLEPEMGEKTDSDLDQCVEMDPDENTECEEHIQHEEEDDDGREVLADRSLGLTELEIQCKSVKKEMEEYLDKSVSLDTDEPSETESAREVIYQRHQEHISSSHPDQAPSNPSKIQLEENTKVEEAENTSKKFEDHHDWRFPRTNNFDCCCFDKKADTMEKTKAQSWFHAGSYATDAINLSPAVETMVNHSSRFDFQNYLGFQTDNTFMTGSSTQVSLSQEKKTDEEGASADKKQEKNEISIMDAIMDNNEWLNVGLPEFRDLPWLSAAASEEKQTQRDKQGQVKTDLAKDDEEPVNKRVATVPPLSQAVNVTFRIHYVTYSPDQLVAVTGSLQELGAWERFIPLQRAKDWFWANTISLPVESQVEWKFVLVEDGRISRWEECANRYLFLTSQDEDLHLDKCWGCC